VIRGRVKLHCCLLDGDCRAVGAPARLHIVMKRRHVTIALSRDAKLLRRTTSYASGGEIQADDYRSVWVTVDSREVM
jgi:hypothetical protein